MRKCKWCGKDISEMRKNALFCRRVCKGMYSRKLKIEKKKYEKNLQRV